MSVKHICRPERPKQPQFATEDGINVFPVFIRKECGKKYVIAITGQLVEIRNANDQ